MGKTYLIILLVIFRIYLILQANLSMIMRILGPWLIIFSMVILHACSSGRKSVDPHGTGELETSQTFLDNLFKGNPAFDSIAKNKKTWNVQVIYTKIDRSRANKPRLTTLIYNKDPQYFYPASTVKLPIALLSLQRLNELKIPGLDKNTAMLTEAGYSGQSAVYNDPNTPDGRPTIANYIRKIFLVSDNDASNRLYEFLGQEYIHSALHTKGYREVQILHRLAISLTEEENRHTNPVNFYDSNGRMIYSQGLKNNTSTYEARNDLAGKGHYANGELIPRPMDFSKKNRINLSSLHKMLIGVVFPAKVKPSERISLTEIDRKFILEQMSTFPRESIYPAYDSINYPDAYTKFIFPGAQNGKSPEYIRVFNKSGNAYGQLIDVAYFCDFKNSVEFFVSAAITCNTDGILNDDKYDYNSIGFPFMKNLGEALYSYELKRAKKYLPDLTTLQYRYNK